MALASPTLNNAGAAAPGRAALVVRALAIIAGLAAAPAYAAGPAEAMLTACSGNAVTIEAITASLLANNWHEVGPEGEAAYLAVMNEGMLLMQAERELTPETLDMTRERTAKLVGQLDTGVTKGTLPGVRLYHDDGAATIALIDPTEGTSQIRCYYAGPSEARFDTLMGQMREFRLLTTDQTYIERGPLDTTTNTTRSSTIISRFKPDAGALGLGETAQLALYVLTRRTKNG